MADDPVDPNDPNDPGNPDDAVEQVEQRPRRWWWPQCCVLAGLGVVVFFVVPVIIVLLVVNHLAGRVENLPVTQVRAWFTDVRDGNYDAAVDRMCTNQRDSLDGAALRTRVTDAGGITDYTIENIDTSDSGTGKVHARVDGPGGDNRDLSLTLRREDGRWRVCSTP